MLAAVTVGCGGGGGGARAAPTPTTLVEGIPVRAGATEGPGAELFAGFSVADGSVLLGTVFPAVVDGDYGDVPFEERQFRALLLVTGDARRVFEAYAGQAAATGLPVGPTSSDGVCGDVRVHRATQCSAAASQGAPEKGHRWVRIDLWRAPADRDRPPLSHVFVGYGERGRPPYEGPVGHQQVAGAGSGNPPLPTDWPSLPNVGEPYESGYAQAPLAVEDGTELVAHPSSSTECGGGGSSAVFRVLDDPEDVLNAVARQQPTGDGWRNDYSTLETVEGDATLRYISWNQGGGSYGAWTVERSDEPTYMLVDHCTAD